MVHVLNAIYEDEFLGFSYGFRPGGSQHQALDALYTGVVRRKVNWVLDLDIQGSFDAVSHDWMREMLAHRIADKRLMRLIGKWLTIGTVDDAGQPQNWRARRTCSCTMCSTCGARSGASIEPAGTWSSSVMRTTSWLVFSIEGRRHDSVVSWRSVLGGSA